MKHFLVILYLLFSGCSISFIESPLNREVNPPPWAVDAIELVKLEWADRLGTYRLAGDDVEVRWFEGECLRHSATDDHYNYEPDDCSFGHYERAYFQQEIHIALGRPTFGWSPAHETALAHEFLHWALDALGDSDSDHESNWWDQLADVEGMLAAAGM